MLRRFLKQRRASAALEFVLVAPLLVALLFGVYDLSNALIIYEEVYAAAHSMAASISNEAVAPGGANQLTYTQVEQGESLIWAQIPALRSGLQNGIKSVTVSSVAFEQTNPYNASATPPTGCNPLTTACNYIPVVVWSVAYEGGDSNRTFDAPTTSNTSANNNLFSTTTLTWTTAKRTTTAPTSIGDTLRSCNAVATGSTVVGSLVQTSATGGTPGDLTSVRTSALTTPAPAYPAPPAPMFVVDVQLNYQPLMGLVLGKSLPLWVSAYWPVRSVEVSTSTTFALNEEFATITPGSGSKVALADNGIDGQTSYELNKTSGLVNLPNYCINTAFISAYGASPETQ